MPVMRKTRDAKPKNEKKVIKADREWNDMAVLRVFIRQLGHRLRKSALESVDAIGNFIFKKEALWLNVKHYDRSANYCTQEAINLTSRTAEAEVKMSRFYALAETFESLSHLRAGSKQNQMITQLIVWDLEETRKQLKTMGSYETEVHRKLAMMIGNFNDPTFRSLTSRTCQEEG